MCFPSVFHLYFVPTPYLNFAPALRSRVDCRGLTGFKEAYLKLNPIISGEASNSQFLTALSEYMDLIGNPTSPDELIVGLPITSDAFSTADAPRALKRLGYACLVKHSKTIPTNDLPVCARFEDGTYHNVISQEENEIIVSKVGEAGSLYKISLADFKGSFSGEYLVAAPTVEALEAKRVGLKNRGHWFWQHVTSQRWVSVEIIAATMVANLLAVAVSLFALQVYDRVIPNASFQTLWVLAAGAFIAIIFEALLRIARGRLVDDMGRTVDMQLSAELLGKLQGMRLASRQMGPAALGSMMREFSSVREFFTATSMGSISDIPFVFVFLTLIYVIAGPVVWVIIAGMILIVLLSLFARRTLSRISEDMQGANSAQSRLLNEVTYGAEAIKLHRAENRFQSAGEDLSILISAKTQEQRAAAARLTFASQAIQQVCYISAVVVGVYLVLDGTLTVGAIIAVSILTSRSIAPVTQLSGAISRWQQVRVAMEGLGQIMGSEQERDPNRQYARRGIFKGQITVADLGFRYGEDQDEVLKLPHFAVEAGETVAILGRNGSGKSTLLKILTGLYSFDSGEVRIDGLEIRQIDPVDLRRNMGVLTQDVTLFSGTLRENLLLGPRPFNEAEMEEALKFSGLWTMVQRHPLGLDMPLSDGGVGLSVGQRQSLGLSRIFLADPQILLLDEPTAAMDQTLEAETIQRMSKWLAGKTCLLTTHRTEILALCDRIAVLNEGKLAMIGPRDDVLAKLRSNNQP